MPNQSRSWELTRITRPDLVIANFDSIIMDPPMPTLPFDVITEVIGHLRSGTDFLTLRGLSKTCRALPEPSQRQLFRESAIEIFIPLPYGRKPTYPALDNLLKISPHLATYILDLTLTLEFPLPAASTVIPVLEKLSSIQSLRIGQGDGLHADLFPARKIEWLEPVNTILQHPSLRRLTLEGYGTLPSSTWQLPALTSINLGIWEMADEATLADERSCSLRLFSMSWAWYDPRSTLGKLLRVAPHLIQLEVRRSSTSSHAASHQKE